VPKVVAAVAVLGFAGPWMMTTLVEYLQRTLQSIPSAVG
jgi:flagellar biosynthesis protein FliQ